MNDRPSNEKPIPRRGGWKTLGLLVVASALFAWPSVHSILKSGFPDGSSSQPSSTTLVAAEAKPVAPSPARTVAIEKLRVGDRVLAHNPEVSAEERAKWSEPDWHQWLYLSLSMSKPDGSVLEIELLRPESWLREQLGLVVNSGSRMEPSTTEYVEPQLFNLVRPGDAGLPLSPLRPIFLELAVTDAALEISGEELQAIFVEMDLQELAITGPAVVHQVQNAPPVKRGGGRVVTATFRHSSGDVINLVVGDARTVAIENGQSIVSNREAAPNAQTDTIGTTSNHPFWSVDRQEYVQAGQLEIGERLQTFSGDTKRVVSKLARPGPQPVFNLEVFAEHVYYVGEDGLLVHNAYSKKDAEDLVRRSENARGPGSNIGHNEAHLPPLSGASAKAHAESRLNGLGLPKEQSTVYRNRRQAMQDLRDTMNANESAIAALVPGGAPLRVTQSIPLRQVYHSVQGKDAQLVSANTVTAMFWKDSSGRLHLGHFQPQLKK